MLEKLKLSRDNKGFVGGVLMDLSNAFDTKNDISKVACLWIHEIGFSYNMYLFVKPKTKG